MSAAVSPEGAPHHAANLGRMAGRYAFSMPSPQDRDGWFRVGQVDVTTTVLITALGVASMFLYAISPEALYRGVFIPEAVRQGEIWRLVLWPLVNPPLDLWMIIGLLFFWYFGRFVEEEMGRKPYTAMVVAATVLPAIVVTVLNTANDTASLGGGRWTTASFSVDLLGIAALVIFTTSNPGARFFFNIPGWIIGAVAVGLRVLSATGNRQWATLLLLLMVLLVAVFGARQRGLCGELSFIPQLRSLSGTGGGSHRRGRTGRRGRGTSGRGRRGQVVEGPWRGSTGSSPGSPTGSGGGLTPLEQAELDTLLDLIADGGIEALDTSDRARLNELSRRLRGD